MSCFVFPSIAYSDRLGYKFDTDTWVSHSDTSGYFAMFDTYGDAGIQHSGSRQVTREYLADYLYSLAAAMLKDEELSKAAAYTVTSSTSDDAIAFAASVVWRESDNDYSKRRYYSMKLQKMGTRTKEHDKRFAEVHRYLDGSRASILGLVTSEHAAGFERMKNALAVDEWAARSSKPIAWGENYPKFFGDDREKESEFRNGLEAARAVAKMRRLRESAMIYLENYASALRETTPSGV